VRWFCVLFVLLAACTSTWDRHRSKLYEHETNGQYAAALGDAQWLIDNAFYQAPPAQQTPAAEARRYLHLARLAARAGNPRLAVEALHQALAADPQQAAAVRTQIERLPLDASEIDRLKRQFAWDINVLAPSDDTLLGALREHEDCWSYRVREVRIRRRRTVKTADGMQRQLTYDARSWVFDVRSGHWNTEDEWRRDAGTEVELVDGPAQPRYQALEAADHHFYADDQVPPCHRSAWQGPYDPRGIVFVAVHLPPSRPESAH